MVEQMVVCKDISDKAQEITGNITKEWHVYTFKEDKEKKNPGRYRVYETIRNPLDPEKIHPTKHVMDIYFKEDEKKIILDMKRVKVKAKPFVFKSCLPGKYKEDNWSFCFANSKTFLSKILGR